MEGEEERCFAEVMEEGVEHCSAEAMEEEGEHCSAAAKVEEEAHCFAEVEVEEEERCFEGVKEVVMAAPMKVRPEQDEMLLEVVVEAAVPLILVRLVSWAVTEVEALVAEVFPLREEEEEQAHDLEAAVAQRVFAVLRMGEELQISTEWTRCHQQSSQVEEEVAVPE